MVLGTFVTVAVILSTFSAVLLVLISAAGAGQMMIWFLGFLCTPVALLAITALFPAVRVNRAVRVLAILSVFVIASVVFTGWPFRMVFSIHKPVLSAYVAKVRMGDVPLGRSRRQIGAVSVLDVRLSSDGNVGLQISGGPGGGIYLVHVAPGSNRIWYNTNWEQKLGNGWYRVYED